MVVGRGLARGLMECDQQPGVFDDALPSLDQGTVIKNTSHQVIFRNIDGQSFSVKYDGSTNKQNNIDEVFSNCGCAQNVDDMLFRDCALFVTKCAIVL